MNRFAIIGFGCGGYNALRSIRQADSEAQVDIYSDTALPPYNPMLTTYYIKGKIPFEALFPFGSIAEIEKEYNCHVYQNTKVVSLDTAKHDLVLSDESRRHYDKILIATGAEAVNLPVGDLPAERVFTMRTVQDAARLKTELDRGTCTSALVVGASMVGIKIVELLAERGIRCTMSDLADHIFPTAAFLTVSEKIESYLRGRGINLRFGVKTDAAQQKDGIGHITFSDGSTMTADIVIMCVGTRAAIRWLNPEQIKMNRAVVVDETMQTSAPGIYAAGDCCEGNDLMQGTTRNIGLWANAYVQGAIAGSSMAGVPAQGEGNILHNITHFMDMDFVSFGDKSLPGERVVFLDEGNKYIEATVRDGRLQCINMLNDFEYSGMVKNCIMHCFSQNPEPLTVQEEGQLAKSGLPNALIRILEGMAE